MNRAKNRIIIILIAILCSTNIFTQSSLDEAMPIRGLAIKIPKKEGLAKFLKFIDEELSAGKVNTLLLRVDYDYQYQSHPELVNN